jgi:hypothetical protein
LVLVRNNKADIEKKFFMFYSYGHFYRRDVEFTALEEIVARMSHQLSENLSVACVAASPGLVGTVVL